MNENENEYENENVITRFFIFVLVLVLVLVLDLPAQQGWLTDYELSGGVETPNYARTITYLERLDSASTWIELQYFGTTPQGRRLPLVVLSKDGHFTPEAARSSGQEVVLVQSGIHAGEIDGKDASLMLLREIAITASLEDLAEDVIILFMPIFNLDGHERISPYNRINQNGPEEMGWRTTAQNFNLNRDYMKADAPEMRAWLRVFNEWKVDMLVDCHVTDGIDFQYNASFGMEVHGNVAAPLARWQQELKTSFLKGMERAGDPLVPYVFPREEKDLSKGFVDWASAPRLSTGYAAARNRGNLLIETHMLKPYKARVTATYRLLIEVLRFMNDNAGDLREAIEESEESDIRRITEADTASFPLQFRSVGQNKTISFRGYASEIRKSDISGGEYPVWDHTKPITVEVPFHGDIQPIVSVRLPRYYLIPAEWTEVIEITPSPWRVAAAAGTGGRGGSGEWNFLRREMARASLRRTIHRHVQNNHASRHHSLSRRHLGGGSRAARDACGREPARTRRAGLLCLLGFLHHRVRTEGILRRVRHGNHRRRHAEAGPHPPRGVRDPPRLRQHLRRQSRARLNFFYERSPWHDRKMNVYPVGRVMIMNDKLQIAND
jgi:hypothetical protein